MTRLDTRQVESLRVFVDQQLEWQGCDRTHRFTRQWAAREGIDWDDLLDILEAHGGFCDCEVAINLPAGMDLEVEEPAAKPPQENAWRLPESFAGAPGDRFSKVIVCDASIGKNVHAHDGEILVPAPQGAKPRKRVRKLVHFFVGCGSGLPSEIGVVKECEPTSAEEFAPLVAGCGVEELRGFTWREAAFVLSRIGSLPPGTPVGTHFMEISGVVGKREELRVHKVFPRG